MSNESIEWKLNEIWFDVNECYGMILKKTCSFCADFRDALKIYFFIYILM